MSDEFLLHLRTAPRPAFAASLRDRLSAIESGAPVRARTTRYRPVWTALAAALLLTSTLAFPAVRAAAQAVLDLFHDDSLTAVAVDAARFAPLRGERAAESPALLFFGEPSARLDPGAAVSFPSPGAAADSLGLELLLPATASPGLELRSVEAWGVASFSRSVDPDRLSAGLDLLDLLEVSVPRALARGSFEARVPAEVRLRWSDLDRWLELVQFARPELRLSRGLELGLLGEIGLRGAGLDALAAHRLATSLDWAATLVVTLPLDAASYREAAVRGRPALLVESGRGANARALLWTEDGRPFLVAGTLEADELAAFADSLRPAGR